MSPLACSSSDWMVASSRHLDQRVDVAVGAALQFLQLLLVLLEHVEALVAVDDRAGQVFHLGGLAGQLPAGRRQADQAPHAVRAGAEADARADVAPATEFGIEQDAAVGGLRLTGRDQFIVQGAHAVLGSVDRGRMGVRQVGAALALVPHGYGDGGAALFPSRTAARQQQRAHQNRQYYFHFFVLIERHRPRCRERARNRGLVDVELLLGLSSGEYCFYKQMHINPFGNNGSRALARIKAPVAAAGRDSAARLSTTVWPAPARTPRNADAARPDRRCR